MTVTYITFFLYNNTQQNLQKQYLQNLQKQYLRRYGGQFTLSTLLINPKRTAKQLSAAATLLC